MEKINSYFTTKQVKALRKLKQETGLTVAELLRRAVDVYLLEVVNTRIFNKRG